MRTYSEGIHGSFWYLMPLQHYELVFFLGPIYEQPWVLASLIPGWRLELGQSILFRMIGFPGGMVRPIGIQGMAWNK